MSAANQTPRGPILQPMFAVCASTSVRVRVIRRHLCSTTGSLCESIQLLRSLQVPHYYPDYFILRCSERRRISCFLCSCSNADRRHAGFPNPVSSCLGFLQPRSSKAATARTWTTATTRSGNNVRKPSASFLISLTFPASTAPPRTCRVDYKVARSEVRFRGRPDLLSSDLDRLQGGAAKLDA